MKTVLFTGYDKPYQPLADITVPLMAHYAVKQGIEFAVWDHAPEGLNIYWTGVARGLQLLKEFDRILYLDVDQLITNPERDFSDVLISQGFHASQDWGEDATEPWHFSMCGFVAHQDCVPLFESAIQIEPEWSDKPFPEQGPMQWLRQKRDERHPNLVMATHDRRIFNAVPNEVCPGQVPEPWERGDFAAHLTMVDLPRRIEIFHELQAQLQAKAPC